MINSRETTAKRLGQLLVRRNYITGEQLMRAIQSQRLVGGRIGTCLLEMNVLSEELLLEALSEQLRVPAIRIEQLRGIPSTILEMLPARIAQRCLAVPFAADDHEVKVATLHVDNLAYLDEIAFCTNRRVRPHIANEVRIFEALERYYGFECPRRYGHLLDRLNRSKYLWDESAKILLGASEDEVRVAWSEPDEAFGEILHSAASQSRNPAGRYRNANGEQDGIERLQQRPQPRRRATDYRREQNLPLPSMSTEAPPSPAATEPGSEPLEPPTPESETIELEAELVSPSDDIASETRPGGIEIEAVETIEATGPGFVEVEDSAASVTVIDEETSVAVIDGETSFAAIDEETSFAAIDEASFAAIDSAVRVAEVVEEPESAVQAESNVQAEDTPPAEDTIPAEDGPPPLPAVASGADPGVARDTAAEEPPLPPPQAAARGPEAEDRDHAFEEVDRLLAQATNYQTVGQILIQFMARRFERSLLFQVYRGKMHGWLARGDDLDQARFEGTDFDLQGPSIFAALAKGADHYFGPLAPMPLHRELAESWGGGLPKRCAALPIRVRDRLVAVLYVDRGEKVFGAEAVDVLSRLAERGARAFEVCILQKKIRQG